MSKDRHIVIIGSGAGGLAAAAYLAQDGFRVTVLEQAAQLGGYLNAFKRKGYSFDPGVHYLGELRPGQSLHKIFSGLSLNPEELFCEMDPEGFDHFNFPEFTVSQPRDLERYRQRLYEAFPRDIAGIDRYFNSLYSLRKAINSLNDMQQGKGGIGSVFSMLGSVSSLRWIRSTFSEFLDYVTDNQSLRAVLAGNCGDYGLPPKRASALYGIILTSHYGEGAFFPRGGSGAMRDALVNKAKADGAEFFTNSPVTQILINAGKVSGVVCEDGRQIHADAVISNAEPGVVVKHLLKPDDVPGKLLGKVEKLKPSMATFSVFLGMKRDLRDHGLSASNTWLYPHTDIDAMFDSFFRGEMPKEPFVFCSPNSLKDDSGAMAPEGGSTLELVTAAPYELFSRWDGLHPYKRGTEYEDLKNRIMDQTLEMVDKRLPGVVGDIVVKEAGSAVTNTHYIRSVRGGAYGPAVTPDQIGPWRFMPKSPIPGLFWAGSAVMGGGVSPCLTSGKMAARIVRKTLG